MGSGSDMVVWSARVSGLRAGVGSVLYLASLPWGWKTYRDHERNAAAAAQAKAPAEGAAPSTPPAATFSPAPDDAEDERPARLN